MTIKEAIDNWKRSNLEGVTYGDLMNHGNVMPDEHYLDSKTYNLNINGKEVQYNEREIYEQLKAGDKARLLKFG